MYKINYRFNTAFYFKKACSFIVKETVVVVRMKAVCCLNLEIHVRHMGPHDR